MRTRYECLGLLGADLASTLGQAARAAFAVLIAEVPGRSHFAQLHAPATAGMQLWTAYGRSLRDDGPPVELAVREVAGLDRLAALDAARRLDLDQWRVFVSHDCQGTGSKAGANVTRRRYSTRAD